jgi:hypothetical protein
MEPLEIKTDADMNFVVHGWVDVCSYCNVMPVCEPYQYSCIECTYICAGCMQLTPYESGGADDMPEHCDECWAKAKA